MKTISKRVLIITVCLFSIILSSCDVKEKENDDDKGSQLHDFAKEYEDAPYEGLTLGLVNDHELTYDGVVYLDKINDTLNVQFANLTESDSEYILKIFYDYKETSFKVNGGDIFINEYIFKADARGSLIIPITLDENLKFDNSHFITVAVLTSPDKHAVDLDFMSNSYGLSATFELNNINGTRRVNEKPAAQEPAEFLQIPYQGLMLNLDFEVKDDIQVFFPPKELKVKSGETVKLAYRAGNYDNADDILFIVLIDWKQQMLDGNKPFMHLENKPEYLGYGEIEITAPSEKGKYEITGFTVISPFELRNAGNHWLNDACYRFTLTVE